ncbi:hypothetical protein [Orientia tsutsugamushi]|nr:hypothetical protein [Orientia tsutsugamushi]
MKEKYGIYQKTKNGKAQNIPLTDEAIEILQARTLPNNKATKTYQI